MKFDKLSMVPPPRPTLSENPNIQPHALPPSHTPNAILVPRNKPYIGAVQLIKQENLVGFASEADAHAHADAAHGLHDGETGEGGAFTAAEGGGGSSGGYGTIVISFVFILSVLFIFALVVLFDECISGDGDGGGGGGACCDAFAFPLCSCFLEKSR